MQNQINQKQLNIMIELGNIANALGFGIYLIGGSVRDLLLGKKNKDIDIVVEGNGITLAKIYSKINKAKLSIYPQFYTAKIIISKHTKIDIASSRTEYYERPASIPKIKMACIKDDLFRRDFTINSLAIQLNHGSFGRLIDFFSGYRDIQKRKIRVLHKKSFTDDPTRVFRALKFKERLGFSIEKSTFILIKEALKIDFSKHLSKYRLFNELKSILKENNPLPIIMKLFTYGLLEFILHKHETEESLRSILLATNSIINFQYSTFRNVFFKKWLVYFMVLVRNFSKNELCLILKNVSFQKKYKTVLNTIHSKTFRRIYLKGERRLSEFRILKVLSKLRTEELLYLLILTKSKKRIEQILQCLQESNHL